MRKLMISAIGAAAGLSFAVPAAAHDQWSRHDQEHEQLDEEHGDVHDQLEAEHAQAHEEGLTPWEHARLHQELEAQHEQADYAIELQHQRQHMRDRWRRQYQGYGYEGYGYQGYGDQGYAYRGYGNPRQRRSSGYSIYFSN